MILIKSFVLLAIAVSAQAQAQNVPGGMGTGMRMHKRHDPSMKKRIADAVALLERSNPLDLLLSVSSSSQVNGNDVGGSSSSSSSDQQSTTTISSQTPDPPPSSASTSTPTPTQNPPTTTTTSSTPTTTSTTSTSSSSTTSTTSTSSTSSAQVITAITRTSQDTYAGISFATTNSLPLRASQTSSDDAPTDISDASGGSSSSSKVAIAATATIAALVVFGALIFLGFWWKKKSQRGRMGEDTWDEASMKEFSHDTGFGAPVVAPPPVARHLDLDDELGGAGGAAAGGLGRSNTKVLPSQSAYVGDRAGTALARSRSQHTQEVYEEEPDELLAMPPVAHHERPRDSAYDIVPAAPPASAYAPAGGYGYSSAAASGSGSGGGYGAYGTSGGLAPPHRKGDHTSYGSGIGHDPFAGSGFVDASRESTYGPGQAGRGAGGAGGAGAPGVQGPGTQWPQGYNPYTGYSQGSQAPYGQAGYGYAN